MSANAFAGAIRPADDVMDVIEWPPNGKLSRNASALNYFPVTAEAWIKANSAHWSPRILTIKQHNLMHLRPVFGGMLLCDNMDDGGCLGSKNEAPQSLIGWNAMPCKPSPQSKRR
jgi:hypothetical protein